MSYYRDYHDFDYEMQFDDLYPMTDLDHQIAKYGAEVVLNKGNKPMDNTVRLEAMESGNPDYIDYVGDIVGNVQRGVSFVLTFVVEHNSFYATIRDTGESAYEEDIKDIPHEVAEFLVGKEEYNKLKDIHKDYLQANPPEIEDKPSDDLKSTFKEVIRLARTGQQPWWSEELKNKSEETINKLEEYYNEKYGK